MAYSFVDENKQQALYWRDVGTLTLITTPIWTLRVSLSSTSTTKLAHAHRVRQYPPAKFVS